MRANGARVSGNASQRIGRLAAALAALLAVGVATSGRAQEGGGGGGGGGMGGINGADQRMLQQQQMNQMEQNGNSNGNGSNGDESDNVPDVSTEPENPNAQTPQLSDKTQEAFSKLKPLIDSKQYDAALAIMDDAEKSADPNSYDMALILDTKAKLLLEGKNDYKDAIEPWERCLQLYRDHHNYFERSEVVTMLLGLAQMNYEVGAESKNKAFQEEHFNRAIVYMRHWVRATKQPNIEQVQFYASLLYYAAVLDPAHINKRDLDQAAKEAQLGLELSIKPRPVFYQLLLAIAQQRGDYRMSAEYMQLLLTLPGDASAKKQYYPDLVSIYNNLAGEAKNQYEQRRYYADAINSIENAQKLGLMKTPKDNYNLVTLYYTVGQYERAIDLLKAGLEHGTIANTLANWQALSYFYQEVDENFPAIDALVEAEQRFPRDGALDFSIAQLYEELDHSAEAFDFAGRAIHKGGLGRHLFAAYQLYAYLGYELKKYPLALKAIAEAEKLPDAKKDTELPRLREVIVQAAKLEREERAAARQQAAAVTTGQPTAAD